MGLFLKVGNETTHRKRSNDDELLRAIKRARPDPALPQKSDVPIVQLAEVCQKYWPVQANAFATYIRQRMEHKYFKDLKICQPRSNKPRDASR